MNLTEVAVYAGLLVGFFAVRWLLLKLYPNHFKLTVMNRVLSVDEQRFLKCLERALGDEYYIMPRVRLLEVGEFQKSAGFFQRYVTNRRIGKMCADFVLCKKADLSVLGLVELEKFSKTTSLKKKARREKVLASVCKALGVKLFYFDGRQDYSGMDVRRLITGRTSPAHSRKVVAAESSMVSVEEASTMEVEAFSKIKSCPKCYSDVVTKIAVKGNNIGEKFLMCRKYPYCDYHLSVKDAVIKDIESQEKTSLSKAGYSNW